MTTDMYIPQRIISLLMGIASACLSFSQSPCPNNFEEKNGVVAVEAEHFVSKTSLTGEFDRTWELIDSSRQENSYPTAEASGNRYLKVLPDTRVTHADKLTAGVNFSNKPGVEAMVSYSIYFHTPGKYFVWVRAFSTGSEDNGVHVGLNGEWPASGQRMQWCKGKHAWTWESKQRTVENHCGEAEKIFLEIPNAGLHTISFSMREDGFQMDKFVLTQVYEKPTGQGPAERNYDCSTKN